ncbi:hypothetical protein K1719_017896 [Acacia pycnantha]|nr:hypothetical protein K1719_017896 [Acacia pycnantha]
MMWGETVKNSKRTVVGAEFMEAVSGIKEMLGMPTVSDFFPGLSWFDLQGLERKITDLAKKLDDEPDSKTPLSMIHVKSLLIDMVVGRIGTSSNSLGFAMAHILNDQEVMKRVQEELDSVVGETMW